VHEDRLKRGTREEEIVFLRLFYKCIYWKIPPCHFGEKYEKGEEKKRKI
jgi:hypothetical protein